MTVKELSELYYIEKEIVQIQTDIKNLKEKNFYKKPSLSEWIKGSRNYNQVLLYLEQEEELKQELLYQLMRLQKKRKEIEEFLECVVDAEDRLILRLRIVNQMTWQEIANELNLDRTTVSKRFYKFFSDKKISHNSHSICDIV